MIDSPSITDAPLDEERVRRHAPTLLMCMTWLYGLHMTNAEYKRSDEYKDELMLALRAAELAITDATGMKQYARS